MCNGDGVCFTCNTLDSISDVGARVNWTYTDASQNPQTNFEIQIATRSDFATTSIVKMVTAPQNITVASARNIFITGLNADTQYYARARGYNAVSLWSDFSVCPGGFKTLIA